MALGMACGADFLTELHQSRMIVSGLTGRRQLLSPAPELLLPTRYIDLYSKIEYPGQHSCDIGINDRSSKVKKSAPHAIPGAMIALSRTSVLRALLSCYR